MEANYASRGYISKTGWNMSLHDCNGANCDKKRVISPGTCAKCGTMLHWVEKPQAFYVYCKKCTN